MDDSPLTYPITIIGGGLVGCFCALTLAHKGFKVALIEKNVFPYNDCGQDGRTTSVSYGSAGMFQDLNLWSLLETEAAPINTVRVLEHMSPYTLDYDSEVHPISYILPNALLKKVLGEAVSIHPLIHIYSSVSISHLHRNVLGASVILSDHTRFETSLVVSAEGRNASSRHQTSINCRHWDYDHTVLVVHLTHERSHENHAWEIFDDRRLLAVLPLKSPYASGIVFAERRGFVWEILGDTELVSQISALFPFYGKLSIMSPRWVYPISGMRVNRLIDQRYVLIGDAAHALHPIAGQAVNLGWRDAHDLAKHLLAYQTLGLDIGSTLSLEAYEKIRKKDQESIFWITHGLYHLFRSPILGRLGLRGWGMGLVNHLTPVKRFLVQRAMGG